MCVDISLDKHAPNNSLLLSYSLSVKTSALCGVMVSFLSWGWPQWISAVHCSNKALGETKHYRQGSILKTRFQKTSVLCVHSRTKRGRNRS